MRHIQLDNESQVESHKFAKTLCDSMVHEGADGGATYAGQPMTGVG